MRVIIINQKVDFTKSQVQSLVKAGEVVFVEKKPSYFDKLFTDSEDKVLGLAPELVDWKFSNSDAKKISGLKAVCLPTTAFDWVDGKWLRGHGIALTNVAKYSTESVAEYAISMMLNLVKKLPLIMQNNWQLDYEKHLGLEVRGKTMGIVGLGSIGTRIAELGKAMGMEIVYWSKHHKDKRFKYQSLDKVMKNSDFIFPTMARNKETKGTINKSKLAKMKKDAFLISITGGDLFDLPVAAKMVADGKLAGLAMESERRVNDGKYKGNILITPPIAWYTKEAVAEDFRIWVDTIIACTKDKSKNIVN